MTQHAAQRRAAVRQGNAVHANWNIEVEPALLDALKQQDGGKTLTQIGDWIGCVRGRPDPGFVVRESEAPFPHDDAVLDQRARNRRNARLLPQQLDVALERGRPDVAGRGGILPGRRREGQQRHDGGNGGQSTHRTSSV